MLVMRQEHDLMLVVQSLQGQIDALNLVLEGGEVPAVEGPAQQEDAA